MHQMKAHDVRYHIVAVRYGAEQQQQQSLSTLRQVCLAIKLQSVEWVSNRHTEFSDAVQELTFPGQERSHFQTVTEKWGCGERGGFNDAVQGLIFPGQERSHSQTVTEKWGCGEWGGSMMRFKG